MNLYAVLNNLNRVSGVRRSALEREEAPVGWHSIDAETFERLENAGHEITDFSLDVDTGEIRLQEDVTWADPLAPTQVDKLTVTRCLRVADPADADVLLDGEYLILQADVEEVTLTLTDVNNVPLQTVTLRDPVSVSIDGYVFVHSFDDRVRTFFQRLPEG